MSGQSALNLLKSSSLQARNWVLEGPGKTAYQGGSAAVNHVQNNPKTLAIPATIAAGALTGGLLMGPVLAVAGFSSIGPVAGSVAAGVQSAGAAGAVFSTLQSAAMGGYGVAAVLSSFIGAGTVVGGAASVAIAKSHNTESESPEAPSEEMKEEVSDAEVKDPL